MTSYIYLFICWTVFEAMFYGDLAGEGGAGGGKKVIRIPDLAPIGFENLLRYAYTDSLNLGSVEDAMLTAYAAKKYLLPHLLRECLAFVDKNVGPGSACSVLEFAHSLGPGSAGCGSLTWQALQVLDRNTYQVLGHTRSLTGIQSRTLATLASRPYLNLYSESSLVTAAVGWAAAEAKRRSLDPGSQVTLRALLQEAGVLSRLRLLSLTPEEMAKVVVATTSRSTLAVASAANGGEGEEGAGGMDSLLTLREQVAVFMNIAVPGIWPLPPTLCPESRIRSAPPDHFVVRRFPLIPSSHQHQHHRQQAAGGGGGHAAVATSLSMIQHDKSASSVKAASCKFQVLGRRDDNVLVGTETSGTGGSGGSGGGLLVEDMLFIVGGVIPIRLDPSYYSVRTPRLDVSLRFTSKPGIIGHHTCSNGGGGEVVGRSEEPVLLDSAGAGGGGEHLTASLSKDKDCLLRLKRPLLVRTGNLNEILVSLSSPVGGGGGGGVTTEDLVVLRSVNAAARNAGTLDPLGRGKGTGGGNEVTDAEGISWIFFKPVSGSGIEFSELFYYY